MGGSLSKVVKQIRVTMRRSQLGLRGSNTRPGDLTSNTRLLWSDRATQGGYLHGLRIAAVCAISVGITGKVDV